LLWKTFAVLLLCFVLLSYYNAAAVLACPEYAVQKETHCLPPHDARSMEEESSFVKEFSMKGIFGRVNRSMKTLSLLKTAYFSHSLAHNKDSSCSLTLKVFIRN
jgi:hypothetical protein